MNLMISEVQITCIILMGLVTLFLAVVVSRYTVVGKTYNYARKILTAATSLVTIHFIVQYLLHKGETSDLMVQRSLVNLGFGIPMSYLFNMSNYYILRKRKVGRLAWWLAPVLFVVSMGVMAVCAWRDCMSLAVQLMAVFYAVTLAYYGGIQIVAYFVNLRCIRTREDVSLLPYLKWTRWSLFIMVFLSFGFPVMTFNPNLLMRSIYGLMALSSAFFYVLSFIGYGINGAVSTNYAAQHGIRPVSRQYILKRTMAEEEEKQESMMARVEKFVASGSYLRNGITQKEAAEEMGISVYRLKSWLNSTDFETFSRWLVYLRLVRAKEMLMECPEMGSDRVAECCGFCDRQYFQRSFRKWMGMTPSQWVKQRELEGSSSDDNSK